MDCSSVHSIVFASKVLQGSGVNIDEDKGLLLNFLVRVLMGLIILAVSSFILVGLTFPLSLPFKEGSFELFWNTTFL